MEKSREGFPAGSPTEKQEVQSGFLTCTARDILAPVIKAKLHKEKKDMTWNYFIIINAAPLFILRYS